MIEMIILILSISVQLVAVVLSVRLIRITARYFAWILMASALLLMVVRRCVSIYYIFSGNMAYEPDLLNETIGLILSILMAAGIAGISPFFKSIKHSEEQSKSSEEKYRSLFDNSKDAIYLIDHQTQKILDCNVKAVEMLGYTNEELYNMVFYDLFPKLEKEIIQNKINEFKAGANTSEAIVLHNKRKNGSLIIIEMNISMIRIKSEKLIFSVLRDITERKNNEDKIRLFFQATDNSVEAICLSDINKRIIYINNSLEKMFGYSKEDFIGKKVNMLYPDEILKKLQKAILSDADGAWVGELTGRKKDGSLFALSISTSRILNDDGTIIARMTTHRDITEIKVAEEKMKNYNQQLRLLTDHLATIREEERINLAREIHDELGSSLTGLKMELVMLKRNIVECSDNKIHDHIRDSIQSMSDLIDSTIVLIRKISSELRSEVLDELGLIEAISWYIKEFEKRANCKFHFTVFPKNIKIDNKIATPLFKMFQEIITNVARHSQATEVNIFFRKQKGIIQLIIHDNGVGIKAEEINNKKSLGILGMQERTMILGGNIQIDGIEGKGTTIKIEIPLKLNINN
jgi:PAS domain S-box-containing protein